MTIRGLVAGVVSLLLALSVAGSAGAVDARVPTLAGEWAVHEAAGEVTDASCVSDGFCLLVDKSGRYVTFDDGIWSPPRPIVNGGYQPVSVSCVSRSYCAAITRSGALLVFDGSTWKSSSGIASPNPAYVDKISCVAPGHCFATGAYDLWTFDGSGWSAPTQYNDSTPPYDSTLDCPAADFCAIATTDGDVLWGTPGSLQSARVISEWDTHAFAAYPALASCWAPDECLAVGAGEVSSLGATGWSQATARTAASAGSRDSELSCVDASWCAVASDDRTVSILRNGTWTDGVVEGLQTIYTLDCWASEQCLVVDNRGRASVLSEAGWSSPVVADGTQNALRAFSCPSESACFAVDSAGNLVSSIGTTVTTTNLDREVVFNDVDCPTSSYCVAVGYRTVSWNTAAPGGVVATLRDGAWQLADISAAPVSVSCGSATFCLARASGQSVVWDGATWTTGTVPFSYWGSQQATNDYEPECVQTFCLVGDYKLQGGAWTHVTTPAGTDLYNLATLSCTPTADCYGVRGEGTTSFETVLGYHLANAGWERYPALDNGPRGSLGCAAIDRCLSVFRGDIIMYGGWYSDMALGLRESPLAIDCPTANSCMVMSEWRLARLAWPLPKQAPQPPPVPARVAPRVAKQPVAKPAKAGRRLRISASASGLPVPGAKWQVSKDGGRTWSLVWGARNAVSAGTRTSVLTVRVRRSMKGWRYRALFTNPAGKATTRAVAIRVK